MATPAVRATTTSADAGAGSTATTASTWQAPSSMVGGTAQVDGGEWVYQDFVYDDYGADMGRGGSNVVTIAPTTGDFRYPAGSQHAGNAADIVEVRARPSATSGNGLDVRVTLNTIIDPAVPALGLAIDTGSGAATEQAWPSGAGVTSVWDNFVTVGGAAATHTGPEGTAPLAVAVDAAANTVELTIPGVAGPDTAAVSLTVGAGLWDAAAAQWMAGSPGAVVPGDLRDQRS